MIQSLPCPNCHRTLILAGDASLKAILRCRHCSHQFVLGEMIDAELGFWEVVDDPNAVELLPAPSSASVAAKSISANAEDDSELELAGDSEYVSPQSMMKQQAVKQNVDWSKFEPITHEQFERMRRKGKNPIWSLLSVMLGGLASIPIATLLIWHLLGKDPLQMGPVVGRYVPWIVPAKFQPYDSDFADDAQAPPSGRSGFRNFDSVIDEAAYEDGTSQPTEDIVDANSKIATTEPDGVVHSQPMRIRDRRAPRAFPMPQSAPTAGSVVVAGDEPESAMSSQPKDQSTPATGAHIFALINEAEKDLQAWRDRSEDRESQKKLAQQIYLSLMAIASAIDDIPPTSPLRRLVRNEMHAVSEVVTTQRDVQQLIQAGARYWLESHRNDARMALALVIDAAEVSETENVWRITLSQDSTVSSPKPTISASSEIATTITPGQKLFVLGIIDSSSSLKPTEESPTEASQKDSVAGMPQELKANYIFVLEPTDSPKMESEGDSKAN